MKNKELCKSASIMALFEELDVIAWCDIEPVRAMFRRGKALGRRGK